MLGPTEPCPQCGAAIRGRAGLGLCVTCALEKALRLGSAAADALSEDAPRGRLGEYEILDEIARGGMGVVYRARQVRLGRVVALKVLLGGTFAGEAGRRRLQREAAAAARLVHPNIVAVHEAGEMEGQPYFTMDFVAGRTLAALVRDGPLPSARAARYVASIAEAVHHAHTQGVLHRDLKPSNVLVDANDEPRVTDFGLAKDLTSLRDPTPSPEKVGESAGSLTLTGEILGSPAYMPPEQSLGKTARIGPATDVYALGAILYELLTGRPPFQGETAPAILEQVRLQEPVAPRRLNGSIPRDLETVCLRCLEKEPERRYPSAQDLAEELRRFLRHEPVRARPLGAVGRAWRWLCRHPLVAGLAGTVAALLLVGGVLAAVGAARIRASRDQAREHLADSLVSEARALRLAGQPGFRAAVLERLRAARDLDASHRLRDLRQKETIAVLAATDAGLVVPPRLPTGTDLMHMCFDEAFEQCTVPDSSQGQIGLYRVRDGVRLQQFMGRIPDEVAGFSRDGRFIAVRHRGAMAVWEVSSGKVVLPPDNGEGTGFNSGGFSPDGARFARAERGHRFAIYSLPNGHPELTLERSWPIPGGRVVTLMIWSPEGERVALSLDNDHVVACDATTGEVRWDKARNGGILALAWSPGRDAIALHSGRDIVTLLDADDGADLRHFVAPSESSGALAFSPDGALLATSSERFGTRLFDAWTGRQLGMVDSGAWHLHFDGEGVRVGTLFAATRPAWLEVYPTRVLRSLHAADSPGSFQVLEFSEDGRRLVSLAGEGVRIWDVATGRSAGLAPVRQAVGATYDPDGRHLWISTRRALVRREPDWPRSGADAGDAANPLRDGTNYWSVARARRRGWMAVADQKGNRIRVLDGEWRVLASLSLTDASGHLAFSPDNRWLAAGGNNGVSIWDTDDFGKAPRRFADTGDLVRFSADGRWLGIFGTEGRLWQVGTWEPGPALPLEGNQPQVFSAAFSPDGRWLAVNQRNREIHLVDLRDFRRLAVLSGPGDTGVIALEFSPDGRRLAAARDRGEIQLWDLVSLRRELARLDLDW